MTGTMFKKAKQNRVFQDVVDQIQNAIVNGDLKAGEKLPPERELKDKFDISRGTLREALRVLEQKGLIEIKLGVGGGAIVRPVSSDPMVESLALLIRRQEIELTQLTEFRSGVEANIAFLAAGRCTENDRDALKKLLDEARSHLEVKYNWDAFIKTDGKFHQELARISRNPVYQFVQKTVHDNIHMYYHDYLSKEKEILMENFEDLCEIFKAVEAGDGQKASDLIRSHVVRFDQYMEDKI